ncbi:hypothetical protein KY345_02315 [Candidatus Woesearchaeota archaeon]|nr:hypothetical protein [Candidatus Woesearchaeota archaeon]
MDALRNIYSIALCFLVNYSAARTEDAIIKPNNSYTIPVKREATHNEYFWNREQKEISDVLDMIDRNGKERNKRPRPRVYLNSYSVVRNNTRAKKHLNRVKVL